MLQAYWNVGREIVEEEQNGKERADYGAYLLIELSARLTKEYGKGFDESNLRNIRKFYNIFPKCDALRHELCRTHYRHLMRVDKDNAREFYMEEAISGNWSTRELETALIDKLQQFLLELGNGFAFTGRQHRITTETEMHFYIDLVFYNYILKCFLLIDLKTTKLTHQDIGQMDMYIRMFEDMRKQEGDNPTIGLILCTEKDRTVVKYSVLNDSKQIFVSKYKTHLPTEKQLEQEIQREKVQIEQENRLSKE